MEEVKERNVVVLVAKYPTTKKSKTRLAAEIGDAKAVEFAMACLSDLITRLSNHVLSSKSHNLAVLYAPDSAKDDFISLLTKLNCLELWTLKPMATSHDLLSSDLGYKLKCALTEFQEEFDNIVFIGSDCVDLPLTFFGEAFSSCSENRVFINPADDGGYVLIGLPRGAPPAVFDGVKWSQECTFQSQVGVVKTLGLDVCVGEKWADVDTVEDMNDLKQKFDKDLKLRNQCPQLEGFFGL